MADLNDEAALRQAMKQFDVSPIVKRFGTWAVTTYGIESLTTYYPIELSRVDESDWIQHLREKTWVDIGEFAAALRYATGLHQLRSRLSIDGRPLKVFLCHGVENKSAVRDLRDRLLALGTDPWLDEDKLLPGQDWKLEISRALRKTDIVVACLSNHTVSKTGFVQRELKEALEAAAERPEGQIFIIPARFDECEVPDSLRSLHWVDLFKNDGFDRLTQALEQFVKSRNASS